jgi:flagellar hook-basal body complex protein FliE
VQTNGIDDLLAQLRATAAMAAGRPAKPAAPAAPVPGAEFGTALRAALDEVSGAQNHALALARDFETGKTDVGLHEVMLAMQKANIALQGTVQVRNRLVAAYQDIMNMQI